MPLDQYKPNPWRPTKQELWELQRVHGSDVKIGKAVGQSKSLVQRRRTHLGIPSWSPPVPGTWTRV